MSDRQQLPLWAYAADGVLALVFVILIQLEIWSFGPGAELSTMAKVVATFVGTAAGLTVGFRSVAIGASFVVNSIAVLALVSVGYESDFYQWTNLLLLYSLAEAARSHRVAVAGLAAGVLGVAYYFTALPIDDPRVMGLLVALLWTVVWSAGRMAAGLRRERTLQADRDLAEALAATNQERLELQARRAEMAREIHDLIGHTVNVMVVHAGAARRAVRSDPDGAERAMTTVETTGREALDELDRVLGVLRSDTDGATPARADTAPAPNLSSLPELARRFDAAGLPTSIEATGPIGAVPAGVALSVYRIVQESLTNTLKHAGATKASGRVDVGDDRVDVTVSDDGRGSPSDDPAPGRGLTGIIERARMHGGNATFGPRPDGGFEVVCSIPLTPFASGGDV